MRMKMGMLAAGLVMVSALAGGCQEPTEEARPQETVTITQTPNEPVTSVSSSPHEGEEGEAAGFETVKAACDEEGRTQFGERYAARWDDGLLMQKLTGDVAIVKVAATPTRSGGEGVLVCKVKTLGDDRRVVAFSINGR